MNSEKNSTPELAPAESAQCECGGSNWAGLLGAVAGLTAATVAIAFYLRANRPEQQGRIDEIIEGVQEKIRALQAMPEQHLKDIDQIIGDVQEKIKSLQSMIDAHESQPLVE